MKRVKCPKCGNYITFDDAGHEPGELLAFQCSECGKQFGIRLREDLGQIVVIENRFHYKQVLPLRLGDNVIGRYQKGNPINTPIHTDDPSMDLTHCTIRVTKDKKGQPRYELSDGPSYTGTFVDNEILADGERRLISHGTLFTIGATSILLKEAGKQ